MTRYSEDHAENIGGVTYAAEAWLQGAGYPVFNQEQHEALHDPEQAADALGMLQDLRDRVGLPDKFVAALVPIFVAAMRDTVDNAAHDFHALLDIQRDWIGHDDFDANDQCEDIARKLREWIDAARAS